MLMSIPSILCALMAYFAIKTQVEKAEEESKKSEGQKRRKSVLSDTAQSYRIRSISRSAERYHLVGEDDDVVDTTSSIARALNTRGSVAPNFFGILDKLDHGGPQRERNVSNVKKNSKLGSIDETIEEDEEEEEEIDAV